VGNSGSAFGGGIEGSSCVTVCIVVYIYYRPLAHGPNCDNVIQIFTHAPQRGGVNRMQRTVALTRGPAWVRRSHPRFANGWDFSPLLTVLRLERGLG
jgi:hypothetical protein